MRYLVIACVLVLNWRAIGAQLQFDFGGEAGGFFKNFHSELLGGGGPALWKVLPGEAPSAFAPLSDPAKNTGGGSVLAQTSQDMTDERFPMFVYEGDKFRNFRFSTQFKIVSGVAEQMAGVVFRFQNVSNFYVARISALGKNIRFYKVVNGFRSDPIGPSCTVAPGRWHQLAVQCDGNQITIWLDGQMAMPPLGDNTFADGKIGFWTKSDSVTYFANAVLDYTPVVPAGQALVDSVLRLEPRLLGLQIYTLATNGAAASPTTTILASKDPSECGQPGTEAERAAIQDGTVSFGRESDAVLVTLPLHDRNGEFIAAVRVKLRTFFGETQDNAVNRALLIIKLMQQSGLSHDDLMK